MVTTRDLQYYLFKLLGIRFDTCPVSGHSAHGQVERMIRTVQECLLEAGIDKVRLHATGVQTLCKLVESDINSIPLGYKYGRNANNSSVLKIITPNVLRMGRVNTRAAAGPMRLPTGPSELIKKIEDAKNCGSRSGTPQLFPSLWSRPSGLSPPRRVSRSGTSSCSSDRRVTWPLGG